MPLWGRIDDDRTDSKAKTLLKCLSGPHSLSPPVRKLSGNRGITWVGMDMITMGDPRLDLIFRSVCVYNLINPVTSDTLFYIYVIGLNLEGGKNLH